MLNSCKALGVLRILAVNAAFALFVFAFLVPGFIWRRSDMNQDFHETGTRLMRWATRIEDAITGTFPLHRYTSAMALVNDFKRFGWIDESDYNRFLFDAWDRPFVYKYEKTDGVVKVTVTSYGRDGIDGVDIRKHFVLTVTRTGEKVRVALRAPRVAKNEESDYEFEVSRLRK
jgi:hypothetical protein